MNEVDPSGKRANEPGAKLDAGKNRLHLVLGSFSRALQEVGRVGTFGANKYTDNGWISVPNGIDRYTDAMLRHYFKEQDGEVADPDSGIAHAAHLAWNALARLELALKQVAHDGGVKSGPYQYGSTLPKLFSDAFIDLPLKTSGVDGRRVEWGFPPITNTDNRMDIVARNGNDGLHYEEVKPYQDDFEQ
jgi:hypothetical protein